ncbi:phage tail protein [Lacticaseibacillus paracasei]|uniref:phage tail protein n=1 Tax=Lacticaseibacillus paracasei TaxID=1597 RepID=UPI00029769BB|nr:tape measure protein [Lacticaseibacillus paracasei]NMN62986.1 tape measure domain-containing protein [Lacticaseibacillus casei]NMN66457.1 tape measure domain-containing protein [Lacticaseibacillus casei CRF28]EKQ10729.1 phage tape measure [Lacticaseibacillus paracasei]MDM7550350.1 tape measure protein [Lacticaseibacillus paracasei]RNE25895.1 tape measure domain protein [Lacticaseibacillus paracasei]
MADSYSVEAILSAVDRNFSGTFKNIANSASKVGDSFEKSTKPAGNFVSTVSKIAGAIGLTKVVGAIGDGVRSMVGELDESSKAWQTFEGNMKFLGKTPAQISSIEKSLQSYAQETIYSSSDMASAYAQFASVGVKGVGSLVKGMGGLAAATDDPKQAMKTLMEQGTQMAAKPMVQWADFRLMLEQTPAGMAAVAKAMGMTTKELVQNVQNGKVSTQQFFDGIEKAGNSKAFQKMATSYKTVGEAMDGLQETLANKLQPAWQAMSKIAIGAISGIIDKIGAMNFDSVLASIGRFFSPFSALILNIKTQLSNLGNGGSMAGIISIFKEWGSYLQTVWSLVGSIANIAFVNLVSVVKSVGSAFGKVFSGNDISKYFEVSKEIITDFGIAAMEALTAVGDFLSNLPWEGIFNGIKTALTGVVAVLKPIAAIVKAAFANDIVKSFAAAIFGAVGAFKVIGLAIGVFSSVLGVFSKMIGPIRGVISVITNFGTIVKTAGGVWKAFGLILGMNPWVLLIAGIAAVVAGLVYFFTQTKTGQQLWSAFVSWLQGAWQGLVGVAQTVWNAISNAFTSAISGIQTAWSGITSFFSNLWTGITKTSSAAWTAFTTTLSAIWQGAVTAATAVWNVLSIFFTTLWNGIVAVATAIWSTFGGSLTTIWNGIVQVATGVWNMLKAVIMGPILIVIDLLTGNWTQLGADLQLIWNSIVSAAGQIWNGLVTYFSGIWSLIQTYAMTVWDTLVSTLEGLWNGAVSAASAIWSALSSFFSGLWNGIVSTTEGVWNSVVSFLSGLWSGTVSTAEGIWNALPGFFSGLWNGITSFFSSAWNNIKSIVIGAATSIFNGAKAVWSGFTGMVSGIVNGIKGAFDALRHIDLLAAGRAIMDSFFNGLKAVWGKITDFVGGIADWIRKHKGPISYDAKLLIPAGNAIMNGLNAGLTDKFSNVQKNVSSMAQAIADSAAVTMPAIDDSSLNSSLQSLNNGVQGANLASNLDVNYTRKQTIEVPLYIDGREVARATANPMQTELSRMTRMSNRRKGLF